MLVRKPHDSVTFFSVKNFINVDNVILDAHSAAAQNLTQALIIWKHNKVHKQGYQCIVADS